MGFGANVIWLLHILLVLWVVITPFTQNEPMLVLHLIMMPFLWFHWILWDDTCALTILEQKLRGIDPSECSEKSFFFNLVSPVYKIQDESVRKASWVISIILWLITLSKVMKRPGMIKEIFTNAKRAAMGEPLIMPSSDGDGDIEQGSTRPPPRQKSPPPPPSSAPTG
jgi:hypothetical protein